MIVDVITAEVNHHGFSVSRRILNSQGFQCLINAETGKVESAQNHMYGNPTYRPLGTGYQLVAPSWRKN